MMLNRRGFLKLAAGTGAMAAAGAGGMRIARAANRPLTFCSWGGALSNTEKKAFMDPASKALGFPIANTSPTNYAKIKAMVQAKAVEWDLVDVGGQFIYEAAAQDLLEPIDYDIVDVSNLPKYWWTKYGVYTSTGATVIAYNTNTFKEGDGPQSWKDFWDVKNFPGPRSLYHRLYYNYEAALLAAGVACDEIYPANKEKIDLAFSKLAEIKPHVKVWWAAGAQPPQLLSTGQLAMSSAWSGRILDVMRENAPVTFTYKEGIAWGNAYIVPKGTPYREHVMKVIDFCLRPGSQERLLALGTYGPVLPTAAAKATPAEAKLYVSYPANMKVACVFNDEEVSKYVVKYQQKWQQFQLS